MLKFIRIASISIFSFSILMMLAFLVLAVVKERIGIAIFGVIGSGVCAAGSVICASVAEPPIG